MKLSFSINVAGLPLTEVPSDLFADVFGVTL